MSGRLLIVVISKIFYVMLDGSSGFCYTSSRMLTTLLIIGFLHVLVYRLQI
jgi:hypothetical protein